MEEHTKALAELTAAISTLTSKIDEIHPVVLELQGWKPTIERSVEDLRAEVGDLRSHLVQVAPEEAHVAPGADKAKEVVRPTRLSDLPPLLPAAANASRTTIAESSWARGDHGHGHPGHGINITNRGTSPGDHTQGPPPVTGM
ncbi:uncharacterized protein [Triticum aestivum]|uniref:uncharacterized protein n=1 Tax=Triticum aestivum TaxID=4565 RepID=UPI001D01E390|nr:uncharacterized protein LOC123072244 [Triticum aestivum]